jgi:VanZ family protein
LRAGRAPVQGFRVVSRGAAPGFRARALRAWLPLAIYALFILALSSIPSRALPSGVLWRYDKLIHAAEYAVLGALVYRGLLIGTGLGGRARVAVAFLAAALFGCLDEAYQSLTPGRHSSVWDALADAVGAGFGVALAWAWSRRSTSRHGRHQHGHDSQLRG